MRKLLLATTVALGASVAGMGVSHAQTTVIPSLLPGIGGTSGTTLGGLPTIQPGTVQVRLGGRVEFFGFEGADSGDKVVVPAPGAGNIPAGTYKKQNYGFYDYARLYPSVDGVAANGLQYGAFVEIRHENFGGSSSVNDGSGGSSVSSDDRARGTLYVRREFVYLGAPAFGTVRFGGTDGPSSLFETGTFENFNDSAWNGDVENVFSGNAAPTAIPFATVGNMYTTTKAVYLSPNFSGFDFAAGYEPTPSSVNDYGGGNPGTLNGTVANNTACSFASPGCDQLSSSSFAANATRRRNTVDLSSRYRGTFGPVGLAVQLGWIGSQHDGVSAPTGAAPAGGTRYSGFNIGDLGLVVSYAGLSVGGHITGGKLNGQWALAPVGATPAIWALGGVSYSIGPVIVGASYFQYDSPGNSGPLGTAAASVGQLRERGLAVGGTYTVAPGVGLFFSYLNGNRKENGVNLLADGEPSTAHNQTNANGLGVGTYVRW